MYNYTVRINAIKEGGKNNSEFGLQNSELKMVSARNSQLTTDKNLRFIAS